MKEQHTIPPFISPFLGGRLTLFSYVRSFGTRALPRIEAHRLAHSQIDLDPSPDAGSPGSQVARANVAADLIGGGACAQQLSANYDVGWSARHSS